jgi:secreted PhoX family phosphatase
MTRPLSRRDFLASGLVVVGAALAGPGVWRRALAQGVGSGPYGPLNAADGNGIRLPDGFTSRVIARSGRRVAGYVWHDAPDGGACFEAPNDGWIYVSNSELKDGRGGVSAVRFDAGGSIADAYSICERTSRNCSGGPTPWHTWLTCEEDERGAVFECDPFGEDAAKRLPTLGAFRHEAAAVDPSTGHVYLTEDEPDGRFYRFVPDDASDDGASLESGTLQVAVVTSDGGVTWRDVPDPSADDEATRKQVPGSTPFNGGEGTWFDDGVVYFTTKGDDRVWGYRTSEEQMTIVHDPATTRSTPLRGVDNITGSGSGDLFVAEDGGNLEIVIVTPDGDVAPLLQLTGSAHDGSELAGPALSPKGDRLYFSSQRGYDRGITYEVRGPFRSERIERRSGSDPLPIVSDDGGDNTAVIAAGIAASAAALGVATRSVGRRRRRRTASAPDA